METGASNLLSRIAFLFDGCDSQLRHGTSRDIEAACSNLQTISQLLPQFIASNQMPDAVLRNTLGDMKGRVGRCALLLESARTYYRGLAIRSGQGGTAYTAAGLEVDFTYRNTPTTFNG